MDKKKVIDIVIRTVKTFFEGALSYLILDIKFEITDFDTFKRVMLTLLMGALSAGICAVINLFLAWSKAYFEGRESQNIAETRTEVTEVEYEDYDSEREENE
jgi:ABC-type sulfate transport system permease subunit